MKSGDIRIRAAKPADFAKVADMHYPVWRQSWAGILADYMLDMIATPRRWATETYPHDLGRRGWAMWIAESGGKALGMTMFGPDSARPDHVQIDALYTAEEGRASASVAACLTKPCARIPQVKRSCGAQKRTTRAPILREE